MSCLICVVVSLRSPLALGSDIVSANPLVMALALVGGSVGPMSVTDLIMSV